MEKYLNKKTIFGILVFIAFSSLTVLTSATWMDGITHFGSKDIGYHTKSGHAFELKDLPFDKGAYGEGYKVTNNSGKDYFIPTRTKKEWDSFKAHTPEGVDLEDIRELEMQGYSGAYSLGDNPQRWIGVEFKNQNGFNWIRFLFFGDYSNWEKFSMFKNGIYKSTKSGETWFGIQIQDGKIRYITHWESVIYGPYININTVQQKESNVCHSDGCTSFAVYAPALRLSVFVKDDKIKIGYANEDQLVQHSGMKKRAEWIKFK